MSPTVVLVETHLGLKGLWFTSEQHGFAPDVRQVDAAHTQVGGGCGGRGSHQLGPCCRHACCNRHCGPRGHLQHNSSRNCQEHIKKFWCFPNASLLVFSKTLPLIRPYIVTRHQIKKFFYLL